ncbi:MULTISPECIES: type II toxin-antitoxin system prevent-host-death family antitoxin [Aerococcus]|uniref:type II toxin-antitoxin system prevent-host-death family antitoxin n=1 Tax=Aerococcus TaxID=1375 RepID=UPI000DCC5288|nr:MULTISPECIES: type II toxin-antitoxin system prevent-host-death family antitoxin [Aerococcus]KAA9295933.1 type II toxin-antitoxin system Phd/YefM family antitoxin [Aerococcus tenax]MDK6689302.1 type II toxin-antitoxin system prevent-host-death family antitoxin [Aerococcus urinae]MDK8133736.1 type II toxin-antitoxin system prevent-host-death family antitoxin [Aerococcus urinae]MDK8485437.1 type II toxin-antitoxin system prevent-host-death family antitoxin [Aerococcus urinae]MDL5177788.1 type
MPKIQSSTDLRNNYNDISNFCNETNSPVFITKNGRGDLAVMSIQAYEQLVGKHELYALLKAGEQDVAAGRTKPLKDVMNDLRKELEHE